MSADLKPCPNPWCSGGSFPSLETIGNYYHVVCLGCGIHSTQCTAKPEAVTTWNTRPVENELRAENQRLREALAPFGEREEQARVGDSFDRAATGLGLPREHFVRARDVLEETKR